MTKQDEAGLAPKGAEGARLKDKITREKEGEHAELFDPGASMLGTDNEAGTTPDKDEMEQARKAPQP